MEFEHSVLNERQLLCLCGLANGLRMQRIADDLGISYKTVEKSLATTRKKLVAETSEQAIAFAVAAKLIRLSPDGVFVGSELV